MVALVASTFDRQTGSGDFGKMRDEPAYAGALFVFNDNEEQFRAFRRGEPDGCSPGGGNAAIRPWRCEVTPRAAGIPTGSHGAGYPRLTEHVRAVVDEAIGVIADLLATGRYDQVVYSASDPAGTLGTGIFQVGDDVKAYVVERLRAVTSA